jgi:hypothetical protein
MVLSRELERNWKQPLAINLTQCDRFSYRFCCHRKKIIPSAVLSPIAMRITASS